MLIKGLDDFVPSENMIQTFPIWSITNNLFVPSFGSTTPSGDTNLSATSCRSYDPFMIAFSALNDVTLLGVKSAFLQPDVIAKMPTSRAVSTISGWYRTSLGSAKPLSFVKDVFFISCDLIL